MKKTPYPGVYEMDNGLYKIQATGTCPQTKKRRWKEAMLPEGTTIGQAIDAREQLRLSIVSDAPVKQGPKTLLDDYTAGWLSAKKARLKPRAYQSYFAACAHHILPLMGHLRIEEIRRAEVDAWVIWAESATQPNNQPYAQATLMKWWRVLKLLLKDASADFSTPDPTLRVNPPQVHRPKVREQNTLSSSQLALLLEQMEKTPGSYALQTRVLAWTGIRVGELYGLGVEDIHDDYLHIQHSASQGILTDTKTHASRKVYAPAVLVEQLRAHVSQMIREQHPGLPTGRVFPSSAGKVAHPTRLGALLREAGELAGLDVQVSPQVLRRTYNTLAVQAGVDRVVLRAQIGHTTEAMTERYSGITLEAKREAFERTFEEQV